MTAILEVGQNQRFCLEPGASCVGRGAENVIQISDVSVSNRHCEIVVGPEGIVIRDLGSTNGTYVGGQRVEASSLNWNQPFRLGNVECVLRKDAPVGQVRLRDASERTENRIDREGWKALGLGLGIAVFVCFVPLLAYIINFLGLIIHETGHTVTAWFFGYPTIPILRPGGGVSASFVRPTWMMILILGVPGKLLFDAYRARRRRVVTTIGAICYLTLVWSGLDRWVITAMGHGAELLVASLFLYRAVSGRSILLPAERPLYATVAFVLFGLGVRFAVQLMFGFDAATEYREGLDGNSHDLVLIADEYLHVTLGLVVFVYLVLCLLAPWAVFIFHRRFSDARVNLKG